MDNEKFKIDEELDRVYLSVVVLIILSLISILIIFIFKTVITLSMLVENSPHLLNSAISTYAVLLIFVLFARYIVECCIWLVSFYLKIIKNKLVGRIFQNYYRIKYNIPKTDFVYYNIGTKKRVPSQRHWDFK